jgi:hypothetical protein
VTGYPRAPCRDQIYSTGQYYERRQTVSYDDLDPDDFDDEDEYEDALEELERAERDEDERRGRRGGVRSLWGDLTGARIAPGGFPRQPEVSWPADVDAWRAGPAAPLDAGLPDLAGPAWSADLGGDALSGDALSAAADVDAWRASSAEPREDEPGWP